MFQVLKRRARRVKKSDKTDVKFATVTISGYTADIFLRFCFSLNMNNFEDFYFERGNFIT